MSKIAIVYAPGDLIWAKMRGFPHWPARVLPYPPEHKFSSTVDRYFVFFYGTYEIAWMASKDIVPYQKYKEKFRRGSQKTALRNAIWEAEEDPSLELSKGISVLRKYTATGKKGGGRRKRRGSTGGIEDNQYVTTKKMKQELLDEEKNVPSNDDAVNKRKRQQTNEKKSSEVPANPPTKKVKDCTSVESLPPSRRSTRLKQSTLCVNTTGSVCLVTDKNNIDDTKSPKPSNKEVSCDERDDCVKEKPISSHGYSTRHKGQTRGQILPKPRNKKPPNKSSKEQQLDKTAGELDKTESVQVSGEMDKTESVHVSGELDKTKSIHVSGELDKTESVHVSGELDKTESVHVSGELDKTEGVSDSVSERRLGQETSIDASGEQSTITMESSTVENEPAIREDSSNNSIVKESDITHYNNELMADTLQMPDTLQDSCSHISEQTNAADLNVEESETTNQQGAEEGTMETSVSLVVEGVENDNVESDNCLVHVSLSDKEERLQDNTKALTDQCVPVAEATSTDSVINQLVQHSPTVTQEIDTPCNNKQHSITLTADKPDSIVTCTNTNSSSTTTTILANEDTIGQSDTGLVNTQTTPGNGGTMVSIEGISNGSTACTEPTTNSVSNDKEAIIASIIESVFIRAVEESQQLKFIPVTAPPKGTKRPIRKKKSHPPKQLTISPTMSMVDAIKTLNYNLKISLVIGYQDSSLVLRHLRDLIDLTFLSSDIEEVKDLVNTLRMVRHFKHNTRVRNRAEELYSKIKSLYVIGEVRPNPTKLNGKHKPQTVIKKINEAAAARLNGECLPSEKADSSNIDTEEKQIKDENVRRSRRSRGRVNYSELIGEAPAKKDKDQEVPST